MIVMFIAVTAVACTIGNGHICGPQTPRAYCNREAYERLVHPKGYGEYWTKADMTQESWRQDWVACGGMRNGSYAVGKRLSGEIDDFANSERVSKQLDSCMKAKGYNFSYKNP